MSLQNYYQPSSPTDRGFGAEIPADDRDGFWNDTGILKAQYTRELSSSAYVRAFAYTFFSDWTQAGANAAWNSYANFGVGPSDDEFVSANYDLITHTAGGELQFADQISSQHLLQLTGNYTTANVMRFNNEGYTGITSGGVSPIGLVSFNNGGFQCWNPATGTPAMTGGTVTGCAPGGSYLSTAANGPTGTPPPGSPAALAGAQWSTLWNGDSSGSYNTVDPKFSFLSLSDQWRPSDRLLFNLALRYENYNYGLDSARTDYLHAELSDRIQPSELLGEFTDQLRAERSFAAVLGDVHPIVGHGLAFLGRTIHRAAHFGVGSVSQQLGQRTEHLERRSAARFRLALPSDSGHERGSIRSVAGAPYPRNGPEL